MAIVLIDNYDSFTYNLAHYLEDLGEDVTVWRNDRFEIGEVAAFDRIVLSPGPGLPSEAGLMMKVIETYHQSKPILGICLGHQALGEFFGAELINLPSVRHGMAVEIHIRQVGHALFSGIPDSFEVGLYHSWALKKESLPPSLNVLAESSEGVVMVVQHAQFPLTGIQFHPESIMTKSGKSLLENWLRNG